MKASDHNPKPCLLPSGSIHLFRRPHPHQLLTLHTKYFILGVAKSLTGSVALLRTASSHPVALHPASRRRSYFSATGPWLTTLTVLTQHLRGRTLPDKAGGLPVLFNVGRNRHRVADIAKARQVEITTTWMIWKCNKACPQSLFKGLTISCSSSLAQLIVAWAPHCLISTFCPK